MEDNVFLNILMVLIGGGFGGIIRFLGGKIFKGWTFPAGTVLANLLSLIIITLMFVLYQKNGCLKHFYRYTSCVG